MIIGRFIRVEIIACSSPEYWYAGKIGDIVKVKKWTASSWGVEEKETGYQIASWDIKEIKQNELKSETRTI
ncbi:MAG: hypothetical protein V3V40_06030 [Nitrosomonadaceae bacterium]